VAYSAGVDAGRPAQLLKFLMEHSEPFRSRQWWFLVRKYAYHNEPGMNPGISHARAKELKRFHFLFVTKNAEPATPGLLFF